LNIDLVNPSAFFALKVYSQDRARNVVTAAAPAAPAPKRETRAELEKIGSEIVLVPMKATTKSGTEMRNVPTPLYKTAGYETLVEFCTEAQEKQVRESQKAAPSAPRGERVIDSWGALQPRLSIPPGGRTTVLLEEHRRLVISCDEEVALQISNVDSARTLRLRSLDTATGETSNVSYLAPAREWPQAGLVLANKAISAVIEKMAT
jgi:hypothetical protein